MRRVALVVHYMLFCPLRSSVTFSNGEILQKAPRPPKKRIILDRAYVPYHFYYHFNCEEYRAFPTLYAALWAYIHVYERRTQRNNLAYTRRCWLLNHPYHDDFSCKDIYMFCTSDLDNLGFWHSLEVLLRTLFPFQALELRGNVIIRTPLARCGRTTSTGHLLTPGYLAIPILQIVCS